MIQSLNNAREELKRADHLLYVSLKYTRTVDVIKSLVQRLINLLEFIIDALLIDAKEKNKIKTIPLAPVMKCALARKVFKKDPKILENIELYALLRKVIKSKSTKREEYRRHVTMAVSIDSIMTLDVNLDLLKDYFHRTKEFLEYIEETFLGKEIL